MIRQKYELYLAHQILKEPDKYSFLANDKDNNINSYKILDNSAFELGDSIPLEQVLEAADVIKADEIVLPDIYKNNDSFFKTLSALTELKDSNYKLAAVAQGKDIYYLQLFLDLLLDIERIDTIMLPKWSYQHRKALTDVINFKNTKKEIHWLGFGLSLSELINVKNLRTIDTGYFTALAQKDIDYSIFNNRNDSIKVNLDFMDIDIVRFKEMLAQQEKFLEEINV